MCRGVRTEMGSKYVTIESEIHGRNLRVDSNFCHGGQTEKSAGETLLKCLFTLRAGLAHQSLEDTPVGPSSDTMIYPY